MDYKTVFFERVAVVYFSVWQLFLIDFLDPIYQSKYKQNNKYIIYIYSYLKYKVEMLARNTVKKLKK